MSGLIEFIPNISEGRNKEIIGSIISLVLSFEQKHNLKLVDYSSDKDHNRTVLTIIGDAKGIEEVSFALCEKALDLIDLNKHKGVHPRIGAVDVMPYVPLKGSTISDCISLTKKVGKRIGEQLNIPVYLYEKSAKKDEHVNLANIRKGEFEQLDQKLISDKPDFGPDKKHPTFGAVCIGCRDFLIAFNINLDTNDLNITKDIAKKIRERNGGYKKVKALGLPISDKYTQVSINFTDYHITNIFTVFEKVKEEANKNNIRIINSELIGLIPLEAVTKTMEEYLKLDIPLLDRLVETQESKFLFNNSLFSFLKELASKSPTPGGGAVSGIASSMAEALISMVCNLTLKKKYDLIKEEVIAILERSNELIEEYKKIALLDIKSYTLVSKAYKDKQNIETALEEAKKPPLMLIDTIERSVNLLDNIYLRYNSNLISDFGVAATLFSSSAKSAYLNVLINDKALNKNEDSKISYQKVQKIEMKCNEIYNKITEELK